jgi:predicted flap endonuclease-1-like 5' DNA nuclease
MADRATDTSMEDGNPTLGRESGIVKIVEREASPVTGAEHPGKDRGDDIDVDADFGTGAGKVPRPSERSVGAVAPRIDVVDEIILDDDSIEVADDEIESAESLPARPSQPSLAPGVLRSRPPLPPSGRPRAPGNSSALPPPRYRGQLADPASGPPSSSQPNSVDPWLLANKTLELSHARARIAELEELVAFRDARILTLEEKLGKAQQKLGELEQKSSSGASERNRPAVTETRLAAVVKPAPSAVSSDRSPASAGPSSSEFPEGEEDELDADSSDAGLPSAGFGSGATSAAPGLDGVPTEEDLRQISGIGPRFEAALRKHGITRLSQIAAWSDADVRQVAKALKIPKSRIVKGRWVESARQAIGTRAASE